MVRKFVPLLFPLFLLNCDDSSLEMPPSKLKTVTNSIRLDQKTIDQCDTTRKNIDGANASQQIKEIITNSQVAKKELCADLLAEDIEQQHSTISANLTRVARQDNEVDFDVLVVGGGVHGATASASLVKANPQLKILVVDNDTHVAKHFRNYGYIINSPSKPLEINYFPNAPLQISEYADVVAGSKPFPLAHQVWNQTMFSHLVADQTLLLNTEVSLIEKTNDTYLVKLTNVVNTSSQIVAVNKIIITTGLGNYSWPSFSDEGWFSQQRQQTAQALVKPPTQLPKVLSYDELFEINDRMIREGGSVFSLLAGKRVAVLGAGDSGKIAIEFLTGFGPKRGYTVNGANTYAQLKELTWIHQKYTNYAEFIAGADTKPRYKNPNFTNIFNSIDALNQPLKLSLLPNKASLVSPTNNGVVVSLDSSAQTVEADIVIVAIGYKPTAENFLVSKAPSLFGKTINLNWVQQYVPQRDHLSPTTEKVGKQACEEKCHPIFIAGGATSFKQSDFTQKRLDDCKTKNEASIEVLLLLTQALARGIAEGVVK